MKRFLVVLFVSLVVLGCLVACSKEDSAETFPTAEQLAFVKDVSEFCERKYGFPIHQVFSSDPSYQDRIYLVYACPQYDLWSFSETPINQLYVYFGGSRKACDSVANFYRQNGYDVYTRRNERVWTCAPETSMVITPEFFVTTDTLRMLDILIHESFHHYVHRYDIGLGTYGEYRTVGEMSEEEALATIVGQLGTLEYLLEKKPTSDHLLSCAENRLSSGPFYAGSLNSKCQKLKEVYEDTLTDIQYKRMMKEEVLGSCTPIGEHDSPNNAFLFSRYLYYNNDYIEYLKKLDNTEDDDEIKSIIQQFAQNYWSEVKNR